VKKKPAKRSTPLGKHRVKVHYKAHRVEVPPLVIEHVVEQPEEKPYYISPAIQPPLPEVLELPGVPKRKTWFQRLAEWLAGTKLR
jgi:hypothetical protein